MKPFKTALFQDKNVISISLEGEMQTGCPFPELELSGAKDLVFDLAKISYINSGGIRDWIVWTMQLNKNFPGVRFVFKNIPPIMFTQIVNIDSFIPKRSKIESVYIPFFCDHCGAGATKLFMSARVFKELPDKDKILALMCDLKCQKCHEPMEIDAFPDKYFACLEAHQGV